jgi:hypothetical protein
MYVCVYVCMYVCMYVSMHVCTYVFFLLFYCMLHYTSNTMYVGMYVYMYVRMHVCMYVCVYIYMYVLCVYVCMYVRTYFKWKLILTVHIVAPRRVNPFWKMTISSISPSCKMAFMFNLLLSQNYIRSTLFSATRSDTKFNLNQIRIFGMNREDRPTVTIFPSRVHFICCVQNSHNMHSSSHSTEVL